MDEAKTKHVFRDGTSTGCTGKDIFSRGRRIAREPKRLPGSKEAVVKRRSSAKMASKAKKKGVIFLSFLVVLDAIFAGTFFNQG